MPIISSGKLVKDAAARRTAVLAFNVVTLEQAEAVVEAAQITKSPVIVQVSHNALRFHGGQMGSIAAAVRVLAQDSSVDIGLQLDHVEELSLIPLAAQNGFSSVMYDAARFSFDENVRLTKQACVIAHECGLWIEAEIGYVGGKPNAPASAHEHGVRTDPTEAADYVLATGVNALAVAVGSSHAMTTRTAQLDRGLIGRIAEKSSVPLVLHGASGVDPEQLRGAISAGITKINVGTALNQAFTNKVRESLSDPGVADPRIYLTAGKRAITEHVEGLVGDVLNLPAGI